MVTSSKPKKKFDWKPGSKLAESDYEAVPEVHETGFVKIADGIYADPQLRKEARAKKLRKPVKTGKEEFLLEESNSGLHSDLTPSEASRLIHKDSKEIQGARRFQKKEK